MNDRHTSLSETALKGMVLFLALFFTAVYIYMVSRRVFYPYELEWLEGYFVSAMNRLENGQPLYQAPNLEFVPFLYPPVYYFVTGIPAKVFGSGFFIGRIVSVVASLLSGLIMYKFISRETGERIIALAGAGLFFACYGVSDFWYDVARVDSLFLTLCLLGTYLLRFHAGTTSGIILSALVLVLAYFTKQSALFFIVFSAVFLWFCDKKKALCFTAVSLALVAGGNAVMNFVTDGWYWFYSFTVPLKHYGYKMMAHDLTLSEIYRQYSTFALQDYGSIKKLYNFFMDDLLENFPLMISIVTGWLLFKATSKKEEKGSIVFLVLMLFAALCASISMRCKFGGHINGIIPTVAVLIIFFSVIASRIISETTGNGILRNIVYLSIALQFIMLRYNPLSHVPTSEDVQAGRLVIETVASFQGDVYLPFHSYYPAMAGKKMFVHKMPIEDVFIGYPEKFPSSLLEKINKKEFTAIMYDWEIRADTNNPVEKAIISHYRKTSEIPYGSPAVFLPGSGLKVRPQFIYTPVQDDGNG